MCEGVRGQAQGLPLPEIWVGTEGTARMGVGGRAQGWPERRLRVYAGRHKACPYRRLGVGAEETARMGVGGQVRGQALRALSEEAAMAGAGLR